VNKPRIALTLALACAPGASWAQADADAGLALSATHFVDSSTGLSLGQDFIQTMPVADPGTRGGGVRSFESLGLIAPTTSSDAYGVSFSGATSPENAYLIDGLSVADPRYGLLATPLSLEFLSHVDLLTGGYLPEFKGAAGGLYNVVTKSGSNDFHGSVFGTFTPGALGGSTPTVFTNGSIFRNTTTLWNQGDFGADVSGQSQTRWLGWTRLGCGTHGRNDRATPSWPKFPLLVPTASTTST